MTHLPSTVTKVNLHNYFVSSKYGTIVLHLSLYIIRNPPHVYAPQSLNTHYAPFMLTGKTPDIAPEAADYKLTLILTCNFLYIN